MVMSQSTAQSSIATGIIELVLGGTAVICGIVSMSKLTSPAATTIGIWALFVSVVSFRNTSPYNVKIQDNSPFFSFI